MSIYPRVAGRLNNTIELNARFHHNGIPASPYAIRRVDIFKGSIQPGNIVAQIPFPLPEHANYPSPAVTNGPGAFVLPFDVPGDFVQGEVYFDVWNYIGDPPVIVRRAGTDGTGTEVITGTDLLIEDLDNQARWQSEFGQFWVYDDDWVADDGLFSKELDFEPLDKRLRKGEIRTIEIALHPQPRLAFEYNRLAPLLPNLQPLISFSTVHCEPLAGMLNIPCTIGIRQGHTLNPLVVQCLVDTTNLLIGSYYYILKMNLGNETIISEPMLLAVE